MPGDEAIARSPPLNVTELADPLDFNSVSFELSDGTRYRVFFKDPEYIKFDEVTKKEIGWSSGGIAAEL